MPQTNIIIDFDSTFASVEALEEIAEIVLKGRKDKAAILNKIKTITNLGVDGKITFNESLSRRMQLLRMNKKDLEKLVRRLKRKISKSFSRNKAFFKKYEGNIYIISNGFKDFIDPVVADYGIDSDHVMANTFIYDEHGWVTGFDETNLLAHSKGKSRTLKNLDLPGESYVIGDSYTDYEMKEAGIAHKFFAFTENVLRENILEKADHITPSFDEFLYVNDMPSALSYPKNRINVLLLSGVHEKTRLAFEEEGYSVEQPAKKLSKMALNKKLKDTSILVVPSNMAITAEHLDKADRLMAIGIFGGGTNHIDMATCERKGVIVFNAPYANTRSIVELVIGNIIMLFRNIPELGGRLKQGDWKRNVGVANEIRGKKLGIIGYGNAGTQLSVLAESIGMDVFYYDIFEQQAMGNATKCATLRDLLRRVDVVSVNVDNRPENVGFFGEREFKAMRDGALLVNLSSGQAVDHDALYKSLKSKKLRGAAIDVFPAEPEGDNGKLETKLQKLSNVILTPHIAGQTVEAHENTAEVLPNHIIDYVNTGSTFNAANFPSIKLPTLKNAHRLIHVHHNRPGILAKINSTMATHGINITGQYLQTTDTIGYVITDINKKYSDEVLTDLKGIEGTIKFRVLY